MFSIQRFGVPKLAELPKSMAETKTLIGSKSGSELEYTTPRVGVLFHSTEFNPTSRNVKSVYRCYLQIRMRAFVPFRLFSFKPDTSVSPSLMPGVRPHSRLLWQIRGTFAKKGYNNAPIHFTVSICPSYICLYPRNAERIFIKFGIFT
jgi:hypothetical protein